MNEAQRSEESGDEGANLTVLLCDACQCKARYVVGTNNSCGRHVVSFVDISAGLNGGGINVSMLGT